MAGVIVGIGKLVRYRAWKMGYGPEGRRLAKHWHRHGGPKHPMFSHREKWSRERTERSAPDADVRAAEAVV
jgi:hypothetical protein